MADTQKSEDFQQIRDAAPVEGGIAAATFATASEQVDVSRLPGVRSLFCPLGSDVWETEQGEAEVLICHVIQFNYTMAADNTPIVEWEDLGDEVPIFWKFVQKQLKESSTDETPWVVGTIQKGRKAYRLTPPIPEDIRAADLVLREYRGQVN